MSSLIPSIVPTGIVVLIAGYALGQMNRTGRTQASKIKEINDASIAAMENITQIKEEVARSFEQHKTLQFYDKVVNRSKTKKLIDELRKQQPQTDEKKKEVLSLIVDETETIKNLLRAYNTKKKNIAQASPGN